MVCFSLRIQLKIIGFFNNKPEQINLFFRKIYFKKFRLQDYYLNILMFSHHYKIKD